MHELQDINAVIAFVESKINAVLIFTSEKNGGQAQHERLARDFPLVSFAIVDVEKSPIIAEQFAVVSSPTLLFYHQSEKTATVEGSNFAEIEKHLESLTRITFDAPAPSVEWPVSNPLNKVIDFSATEILNVDTADPVKQAHDLFSSGLSITKTDADSQLLAFVPFHNKVDVSSIIIQLADEGEAPHHARIFASLPGSLSFDDAESLKALYDEQLPPAKNGWIELKLRFVLFQNISSILLFLRGDDDDEPIALKRIVFAGKTKEKTQPGTLFEEE